VSDNSERGPEKLDLAERRDHLTPRRRWCAFWMRR
jgi:hypothetical protein